MRTHIIENIRNIEAELSNGVTLVVVSKTKPISDIEEAYRGGSRIFGESKVQELTEKYEALPKDIQWHFIGHLQTNKIKYMAPFVSLIHSVDSAKLLEAVNKEGMKCGRVIDCLLQFHIAEEETKFGLDTQEAFELLQSERFRNFEYVRIVGVMGMATYSEDAEQVKMEFRHLHQIFIELKQTFFESKPYFKEISMGMSGDYGLALEEGSTMVRIGSSIFGARDYSKNV